MNVSHPTHDHSNHHWDWAEHLLWKWCQKVGKIYEDAWLSWLPDIFINNRDVTIINRGNKFLADFPITVDEKHYKIRLLGDNALLQSTRKIGDRVNPLYNWWTININWIIYGDIPEWAIWQLLDTDENPLNTNPKFWNYFRKRIPSTHPLSTINIH